jgi:hypothetical protein
MATVRCEESALIKPNASSRFCHQRIHIADTPEKNSCFKSAGDGLSFFQQEVRLLPGLPEMSICFRFSGQQHQPNQSSANIQIETRSRSVEQHLRISTDMPCMPSLSTKEKSDGG